MILIARLLLTVGLIAIAMVMFAGGLVLGLVGTGIRVASGRDGAVHTGAEMIRSIERLPLSLPKQDRTYVYFIQDELGAIKIGISADPHQRIATLQTGHPEQLHLRKTIRCRSGADARAVEADLHEHFARCRMNGEWFDLDEHQLRRAIRLARRWR